MLSDGQLHVHALDLGSASWVGWLRRSQEMSHELSLLVAEADAGELGCVTRKEDSAVMDQLLRKAGRTLWRIYSHTRLRENCLLDEVIGKDTVSGNSSLEEEHLFQWLPTILFTFTETESINVVSFQGVLQSISWASSK